MGRGRGGGSSEDELEDEEFVLMTDVFLLSETPSSSSLVLGTVFVFAIGLERAVCVWLAGDGAVTAIIRLLDGRLFIDVKREKVVSERPVHWFRVSQTMVRFKLLAKWPKYETRLAVPLWEWSQKLTL